ncbi:MAG: Dabb family protein [Pyrinomonadaceae bacterium]
MFTHIVVWKYKEDVDTQTRQNHVERLRTLSSVVDGIESFVVGADTLRLDRSYDTGLVAIYRDQAAYHAYAVHPEHVKVAEFGHSISEHVASVDFGS